MKRMYQMIMLVLLVGGLTGLSACSDDATPSTNNEMSDDADAGPDGSSDVEEDTTPPDDGGTDGEDEPDACVPTITECSAEMCGQVDDGCGEMLDCGGCPCEAGVVQEESCGTCGLGERTCAADETGFGSCNSPSIPGVEEDADEATCEARLVFVDAGASATGDGGRSTPFTKYADAYASATSGNVIILGGQTAFAEALNIKKGVSVIGGFSSAPEFRFSEAGVSRFVVPAPQDGDVFGIKAEEIDTATTLAQIEVETADAADGGSNYGAYLRDSSELTMRSVDVRAGAGGNGADGSDGAAGSDGGDGADGKDGSSAGLEAPTTGAAGGVNPNCPAADGGDGGDAYWSTQGGVSAPTDGESTSGADGGDAGIDSFVDSQRAGEDGQDAQTATSAGQNGAGGTSGGQVANDVWGPTGAGIEGTRGQHGHGGGGGGGTYFADNPLRSATSGAGGGAGGCGGEGGSAGEPGGGSFGLFLVRSDPTLIDTSFRAGLGGVGGPGGNGGPGGRGGDGGDGTNQTYQESQTSQWWEPATLPYFSGSGGDGSDGRDGGAGGGGAGGVSYGVYCSQSRPSVEGSTTFVAGGSAHGGQSAGNAGNDGVSEDSFGCE